MKLAMAQMSMSGDMDANLNKSLRMIEAAKGCDLLFFPEIQLTPFFPQYPGRNVDAYVLRQEDAPVRALCAAAQKARLYLSPNVYLEQAGRRYDTSLWINPRGELKGLAKMVHIAQAHQFCEQDYYTPSDEGFRVFDTPFGRVGIVICYDRHLPESVRTCTLMGADLILIPTANTAAEPMELFEWEIRVQAMQNSVFIAMCNRVGTEDEMEFAGESLVADPDGALVVKAGAEEGLITAELDLAQARAIRSRRPYLATRRPEWYL